jgi:hypothetical protein
MSLGQFLRSCISNHLRRFDFPKTGESSPPIEACISLATNSLHAHVAISDTVTPARSRLLRLTARRAGFWVSECSEMRDSLGVSMTRHVVGITAVGL